MKTLDADAHSSVAAAAGEDFEVHKHLTHTNLDSTCCDMNRGWFARLEYQRTLLTALNPKDRDELIVLVLVLIFWTCVIVYLHAFASGFLDGFTESAAADSSILT